MSYLNDKHIKISYIDDIQNSNSEVKTMAMQVKLEDGPAARKEIPENDRKYIVSQLRQWLGKAGVSQFKKWRMDHGTVSPVLFYGTYPHAVHFREGMQVRNFLRAFFKQEWNDHEYDDNWQWLVEEAIDLEEPFKPKEEPQDIKPPDAKKIEHLLDIFNNSTENKSEPEQPESEQPKSKPFWQIWK